MDKNRIDDFSSSIVIFSGFDNIILMMNWS